MSTQSSRLAARVMVAPSVLLLFIWMVVPLAMTLYYSFRLYRLISPDRTGWVGFTNYLWFINAPEFWLAMGNTGSRPRGLSRRRSTSRRRWSGVLGELARRVGMSWPSTG